MSSYLSHIEFAWPWSFLLLLLIPYFIFRYFKGYNGESLILISSPASLNGLKSWKNRLYHSLFIFRILAMACIIVAMARPQSNRNDQLQEGEGIDIVLCMDVSGSMSAMDLLPDRLEAAKKVAADFVRNRPTDRIGVVVFAGESFSLVPLTSDKNEVISQLSQMERGLLLDGTSIGDGLGVSIARIREAKGKTKVIILLTDGEDQGGRISPTEAKLLSKAYGVRIYTIGIGTDGFSSVTRLDAQGKKTVEMQKVNIDEALLKSIALETGGLYYRAKDNKSLESIYASIDKLEKSRVLISNLHAIQERYHFWVILALIFISIEFLLSHTLFRTFPY